MTASVALSLPISLGYKRTLDCMLTGDDVKFPLSLPLSGDFNLFKSPPFFSSSSKKGKEKIKSLVFQADLRVFLRGVEDQPLFLKLSALAQEIRAS